MAGVKDPLCGQLGHILDGQIELAFGYMING